MNLYHSLSHDQKQLIDKHLDLVIEANRTTNITRITSKQEAFLLHIEDSLSALPEINEAPVGNYADMGSGAGYPGIPVAIATGRNTTLIDARQKKVHILDGILQDLGLTDQIKTFAGRAELLAIQERNEYAVITARALAKLPVLMELASPLLKEQGRLICYKANIDELELSNALEVQKLTGMKLLSQRSFQLGKEFKRTIVVFEKTMKPRIKLPRREGEAQKNPLRS